MVDLSKFIDNSLKSEFQAKPYTIDKDRAKLVARFSKAADQFPSSKAPNKIWKLANGVVEVRVPLGSGALNINGSTTNYVPEGQFKGFITALIEATQAGEFDGALKAVQTAPQAPQKASSSTRGGSRAPDSDPLSGIRKAFGIRMGKQGQSAKDAAAALKKAGKYSDADIDAVLAEKTAK